MKALFAFVFVFFSFGSVFAQTIEKSDLFEIANEVEDALDTGDHEQEEINDGFYF